MEHEAIVLARGALVRLVGEAGEHARIELKPLRGGLEAVSVTLVTARYEHPTGRPALVRFVMKRLAGC